MNRTKSHTTQPWIAVSLIHTVCIYGMLFVVSGCSKAPESLSQESIDLNTAMSGDTTGYDRAVNVRDLVFPDDYGPHPSYKTEWWYFTGNLNDPSGRKFGYELTIFRSALAPPNSEDASTRESSDVVPEATGEPTEDTASSWKSNQLYMGHFSLANVQGFNESEKPTFYSFERFSRGALGLAGSEAAPFRIWLDDWTMEGTRDNLFPIHLKAADGDIAIDLTLSSDKPIVLQGDRGLDQKGEGIGNASYYYSFTRLPTVGTITIGEQQTAVSGTSWKDHEWSTSALDENQEGWDWFALQLSDNREIMFYVLREKDGSASAFTNGMLVHADGTYIPLKRDDVRLEVTNTWTSPHSGATYPSGWIFEVPDYDIALTIQPLMKDQELNATVRYWEGAVSILDQNGLSGRGYVELTGYK